MFRRTLFIFISALLISCEGPTGPAGKDGTNGIDGKNGTNAGYDKQIRLYFNGNGSTSSNNWVFLQSGANLVKFNKLDYVGVDSIIFIASLKGNTTAQLFNITDNHEIYNSVISSTSSDSNWKETSNIIAGLPKYEITIGVQFRVTSGAGLAEINSPMLILYRK